MISSNPNPSFWKDKNVLITGITGFVGSWLAETLTSDLYDVNVYGLIRRQSSPNTAKIGHLLKDDKIKLIRGDLHDVISLANALKESRAEIVYHLAAQSFVPHSFEAAIDTYNTNVMGTINLLEAIRHTDKNIKIHFAGSSEEYGLVLVNDEQYHKMLEKYNIIFPPPQIDESGRIIPEIPIKETNPLRAVGTSPYGSSKRMCEDACRTYFSSYGINVYITRAFNHTGPRRGIDFVTSVVTSQVAQGIKHGREEIVLGNLTPVRDFSDVRDVVKGYMLVVEKGEPGDVYNLCSGKGTSIEQLKDMAIGIAKEKLGLKHDMRYKMNQTRLRPTDLPILIGDYSKAKEKLGWQPIIPLEKTIEDMINFYLETNIGS
jgi:GDPmannose 4,6-dehydratase